MCGADACGRVCVSTCGVRVCAGVRARVDMSDCGVCVLVCVIVEVLVGVWACLWL